MYVGLNQLRFQWNWEAIQLTGMIPSLHQLRLILKFCNHPCFYPVITLQEWPIRSSLALWEIGFWIYDVHERWRSRRLRLPHRICYSQQERNLSLFKDVYQAPSHSLVVNFQTFMIPVTDVNLSQCQSSQSKLYWEWICVLSSPTF